MTEEARIVNGLPPFEQEKHSRPKSLAEVYDTLHYFSNGRMGVRDKAFKPAAEPQPLKPHESLSKRGLNYRKKRT